MPTPSDTGRLTSYYQHARPEVVELVRPAGLRVLDVGCAAGSMGAALLARGAEEVVGVEIADRALQKARSLLTRVHRRDLSRSAELPYPQSYFDCLVFADVLEHLPEPLEVLRTLLRYLHPSGRVVLSLPNVRHCSVLMPLLLDGQWEYADEGVLDRTHLRFFTRRAVEQLIEDVGLELVAPLRGFETPLERRWVHVAEALGTLGGEAGLASDLRVLQFLAIARRRVEGVAPDRVPSVADAWGGAPGHRVLVLADAAEVQGLSAVRRAFPGATVGLLRSGRVGTVADSETRDDGLIDVGRPESAGDWERLLSGTHVLVGTPDSDLAARAAEAAVEALTLDTLPTSVCERGPVVRPSPRVLCMLRVKNEERWIGEVLEAAAPLVDGFVVLDDGSEDGTAAICRGHPKVLRYEVQHRSAPDEARDKDRLLQATLDHDPDWILALDGDEVLEDAAPELLRAAIHECPEGVNTIGLLFLYMWNSRERYRCDGKYRELRHPRLFRVSGLGFDPRRLQFRRTEHGANFHCGSVPSNMPGQVQHLDVVVKHFGYFDHELRARKRAFYERLDPDNAAAGYYDHLTDDRGIVVREWLERREGSARSGPPARGVDVPAGESTVVSIVIPVWNKVEVTRACLETLAKNTSVPSYEVVLVDNGSSDATAQLLAALSGDVKLIRNAENRGFVEACNQGAAVASGRYLLFLNNDTLPQDGWLDALVQTAERDPAVGAVGARLVYPDGRLQEAGGLIFSDASGWNFGRGDDPFRDKYDRECEVDYCSGAALLVRRDLFEKLGGFDRRYAPAYYEDTDLCFGLRSLGFKVMYCPRSIVVHCEGVTAGTDLASGMKRYQVENRAKFAEKWKEALERQDPPPSASGRAPDTADRARLRRQPGPIATPPQVLVVDPFLPLHDRASGSLRLFRLVQIMRALDWRVTYLARNANCQERYQRDLEALGVEVIPGDPVRAQLAGVKAIAPELDLGGLLRRKRFDVAWLSFWYIAEQYLPWIRVNSPSTYVVADSVDVHFLRERREAELQGSLAALGSKLGDHKMRELGAYELSDAAVTVTEDDARVLRAEGISAPLWSIPNVHVPVEWSPTPFRERSGLLFVGNFGHTPNADAVRWFCTEIFPKVTAQIPETELTIVGPNPPAEVTALQDPHVKVTGHVPSLEPYLRGSRVAVAPLRYGAGMKGKVGEALGCGLPVVTTQIGAEGMGLVDGTHALIADDADAFAAAIVRAYTDERLWDSLSTAGKSLVQASYGPAEVGARLGSLLTGGRERRVARDRLEARAGPGGHVRA